MRLGPISNSQQRGSVTPPTCRSIASHEDHIVRGGIEEPGKVTGSKDALPTAYDHMRQMTLQDGIVCQEADVGEVGTACSSRGIEARSWQQLVSVHLHDHACFWVIEKSHAALIQVDADDPFSSCSSFCCVLISQLPERRGLRLGFWPEAVISPDGKGSKNWN